MQLEAIRITHPRFDPEDFGRGRYTMDESRLICQIANSYSDIGQRRMALNIYSQLLRYIEKNDQALAGYAGQFCLVANNFAIDLAQEGYFKEAIEL